jgi:hypothetical protein
MRTTSATRQSSRPRRRCFDRLRQFWSNQTLLWDRTLDDLEPWRQEGPLRWRGGRLEGVVLADRDPLPTL